jgi:hypothetical protein
LVWRSLTVDKLGTRLARNLQVGFDIKEVVNCTEFQVRGAHLKKLRRAEGGAKFFGVFRVKNHDFTPTHLIFSNFRGGTCRMRPPRSAPGFHFFSVCLSGRLSLLPGVSNDMIFLALVV